MSSAVIRAARLPFAQDSHPRRIPGTALRSVCLVSPGGVIQPRRPDLIRPATSCSAQSRRLCIRVSAGVGAISQPDADLPASRQVVALRWLVALSVMAAVVAGAAAVPTTFKEYVVNGPLGRSGFLAAFSLIFLSEIGDKTFFIAALLAMKLGRWVAFLGSLGALAVMTVISVAIGAFFSRVPDALKTSLPLGEIAGILLLVFFGLKSLREGYKAGNDSHAKDEELADAESAVKEAETSGRVGRRTSLTSFFEVATLIFLAEWGDRSMLATIALGAAQNPVGVAVGATAGHAVATAIAVIGGAIASKYVSERTISLSSGVLFLLFAAVTAWQMI